jgi:putative ABC transport system permease protein
MTSLKTAFFIAYKSIRRGNRSALALTVFILTLSYFNLMFITGIMSGLTGGMVKTVIETGAGHITILPQQEPTLKQYIPNEEELRARIETIPGVIGASGRYRLGATITHDPEKDGKFKTVSAPVIGIDAAAEGKIFTIDTHIVNGEYLSGLANDEILLSVGLAGGYGLPYDSDLGGVRAGDEVDVTFSNGIIRTYKIKGLFEVAGTAELSAFINAREAESILGVHNEASEVVVMADTGRISLDELDTRISAMAPTLDVKKYTERLASVETFLGAFDLIAYIVSTISVAVAAVTIFVIIYVNAISRRRQIGILKAIGIETRIIELSYVFQSIFYALSGVGVGLILVFGIIYPLIDAYPIPLGFGIGIRLIYSPTQIVVGILALVIAGLLAGFVPARIVARQDILKAIWG